MKMYKFLFLIIFTFLFSSCKLFKPKEKETKTETVTKAPAVKVVPKDTAKIVKINQEIEPVKEVQTEPGVGYTSDKYYMVVGSFFSEKLALKYAKTILDMGYKPQVIYSASQGYYRVSAKSYDDFKTAINDISSFRGSVTNRAWVHVKK